MRGKYTRTETGVIFHGVSFPEFAKTQKPGDYYWETSKASNKDTVQMGRYFHGAMLPAIASEIGEIYDDMDREQMKKILDHIKLSLKSKYKHIFKSTWFKDPLKKGKRIYERESVSDLDKEGYSRFITAIRTDYPWIPAPEDKKALGFYDEMIKRFG